MPRHRMLALQRALRSPWAIRPEDLAPTIAALVQAAMLDEASGEPERPEPEEAGQIAILPFHGVVLPHPGLYDDGSPAVYTEWWLDAYHRLLADPSVAAVVVKVDSPGGIVYGTPEIADAVRSARDVKPSVAVVTGMGASAAFWLATAFERLYVSPSSQVGSVGVLTTHVDISKALEDFGVKYTLIHSGEFKVEGNPFEPLGKEARAEMQRETDAYYEMFVEGVARNRGVTTAHVLSEFGQGRVVNARAAVERGMADDLKTLDQVVRELMAETGGAVQVRGGLPEIELRALPAVEVRAVDGEDAAAPTLAGTGLRFRSLSQPMVGYNGRMFREEFAPGAFDESLREDDVRVVWQHDNKYVFGRVRARTARVWADEDALHYTATPPNAQWARDAMESIRRGDVSENSFAFLPVEGAVKWERRPGGMDVRVITKARLFEVGPQTNAAYQDTDVQVRGMAAALREHEVHVKRCEAEALLRTRQLGLKQRLM